MFVSAEFAKIAVMILNYRNSAVPRQNYVKSQPTEDKSNVFVNCYYY